MARPLRIEFPQAYYHIMNRGINKQDVFFSHHDHYRFIQILKISLDRFHVKLFAYCLMKNHYHLCVQTLEPNLSKFMRHIDGVYTQYVNKIYKRDGSLFRGRYKSILVQAESYLLQVIRYIHLNPVKAGFVDNPSDYLWSSHRYYLCPWTRETFNWIAINDILMFFTGDASFQSKIDAYQSFIGKKNDRSFENFYEQRKLRPILGSQNFIQYALNQSRVMGDIPKSIIR